MKNHPAHKYAIAVRDGKITAGRYIKLAVERYFKDLEFGHERGLYFDEDEADRSIRFYSIIKHTKGEKAGTFFKLEPWQQFINWNLFGWYTKEGVRRFRYAYVKVARKNGKSTLVAPIGLYKLTLGDYGEGATEVYSSATKKEQARIVFDEARRMVNKSEVLKKLCKSFAHEIRSPLNDGIFKALGSDSDTMDGLNPVLSIIDEYHAHVTDGVFEVMKSALGARQSPLIYIITTAGKNKASPCFAFESDCKAMLEGNFVDDTVFAMIFDLDESDFEHEEYIDKKGNIAIRYKWESPEVWKKANPNLGVSVSEKYLADECKQSLRNPLKMANFMTKNLNVWVGSPKKWIPSDIWMQNYEAISDSELEGLECWGGMDLAMRDDFCSFVLLFLHKGRYVLKHWCWIPENTMDKRISAGLYQLSKWVEDGHVFVTQGDITDYSEIQAFILDICQKYNVLSIGYDPYNATNLVLNLQDEGINMRSFGQTKQMIVPTKLFYELAISRKLNHLNSPVLNWMIGNVEAKIDKNENMYLHKGEATKKGGKIDGIIASVIALGEQLSLEDEQEPKVWGFDNE